MTLTEEDLRALYGADYFNGDEYADYLGDKAVIQKNLRRWLNVIRRYSPGGSLVEIGSAYGFFLELAQKHFKAVGFEVSEEAVQHANSMLGVDSRCQNFLTDGSVTPGSVDVVAMWDVIEHVDAPGQFVYKAGEILRPGGHLFITTGDIDSWLPRRQGPRWRLIHPPTHLQYFSRKTLSHLLELKGFEVVKVMYPGYWRSIKQILHGMFVLGHNGQPSTVYNVMNKALPGKLGIYLNTFDIMYVVARRLPAPN